MKKKPVTTTPPAPFRPHDYPDEGERRLRSVRLTDPVWLAIMDHAQSVGCSASDVVDALARKALRDLVADRRRRMGEIF